MSIIQSQITLIHADSGLTVASVNQRPTVENGFSADSIAVTTTPEAIVYGADIVKPRQYALKLVSGDDVLVSIDGAGAAYPLSLSGAGDAMLLNMDVRTTSLVTAVADVASSLVGKYFIAYELAGPVWVWFDGGTGSGTAATGSITYGVPSATATVTVNGTVFTWIVSAPGANEFSSISELTALIDALANISATDDGTTISIAADAAGLAGNAYTLARAGAGTLAVSGATLTGGVNASIAPTVTTERLLPVTIVVGSSANTIADAVAAALDADASFLCANPAAATLSIIHAQPGTFGAPTAGTSGFTSPSASTTTPPTVYVKSLSTSQLVVGVAPV